MYYFSETNVTSFIQLMNPIMNIYFHNLRFEEEFYFLFNQKIIIILNI